MIVLMTAVGCRPPMSTRPSPAATALRTVSIAYNRSAAANDANAIVQYFAPDVLVMSPQGSSPVRGVEANRVAWERSGTWTIVALSAYPFR